MTRSIVLAVAAVLVAGACTAGAAPAATPSPTPAASARPPATAAPTASVRPVPVPSPSAPPPAPASTKPSASQPPAALPSRWTKLAATGPAAREDHTLTAAPDGSLWLFGGRAGATVHGDLWRFDPASAEWRSVAVEGVAPEARFGHTATWVDGVGLVVWSGQSGPSTFFDDLWALDPATTAWRELAGNGDRPAARYGSCAALGPDGRLWVSHGFTNDFGRFDDTWTFDFDADAWTEATLEDGPFIRCLHDCLWTPDGRFLVYAGQTTGAPAVGDLWARPADGGWAAAPPPEPPARQLYALGVRGAHAWVFGGGGEDRSKLGDLWRLDLASLAWESVGPAGSAPSPRSGAAFAHDPGADRLLLFGGLTDDGASDETWALEFGG